MTLRLRPGLAWAALMAVASLSALAGCDQTAGTPPPDIAGVYEGGVEDGRTRVGLTVRLAADATGTAYVVDRLCRLTVYDGGLGCLGTCRLTAPIRPTGEGRVRFALQSEPDHPPGYHQDSGEATATFDHAVSADGQRLNGTADFECSYNDGTTERTLSYQDQPFALDLQPGVE